MIRPHRIRPPKKVFRWKGPKPPLDMEITPICRVKSHDLEAYLSKVFRMYGYDIRLETGARGDMTPEFFVSGDIKNIGTIQQQVDYIRQGQKTHRLGLILNVLCMDGFIQAGIYRIDLTQKCDPIDEYRKALSKSYDPLNSECLQIKRAHKKNRKFISQVALLDQKAIAYKKENTS